MKGEYGAVYSSPMEFLHGERVVRFNFAGDGVEVVEQCDDYFSCKLTYTEMRQLIAELQAKCDEHEGRP